MPLNVVFYSSVSYSQNLLSSYDILSTFSLIPYYIFLSSNSDFGIIDTLTIIGIDWWLIICFWFRGPYFGIRGNTA
jgi:hypothetical protein